jgi:hypothetical protein
VIIHGNSNQLTETSVSDNQYYKGKYAGCSNLDGEQIQGIYSEGDIKDEFNKITKRLT